jgi:DMSO/TMAO reductase YedYZ heme-binding membrane subunit
MTLTNFLNRTLKFVAICPFFYWVAGFFMDWLGVEPIVKINTQSGYVVLIFLLVNLAIGAIHSLNLVDIKWYRFLYISRRFWGVMCGFYVILHFSTYLAKESFLPKGWEQIVTKNYLIAGTFAAFLILILTVTSNNISTRLLKKKWKMLHRLVYLAFFVMLFHVFQIEKANLLLLGVMVTPVILFQIFRLLRYFRNKTRTT